MPKRSFEDLMEANTRRKPLARLRRVLGVSQKTLPHRSLLSAAPVLMLLAVLIAALPACSTQKTGNQKTFARATITRLFGDDGHPLGKDQPAILDLTDPNEIATLAAFFPQMGQHKTSPIAGGWKSAVEIRFFKADGSIITVSVSENDDLKIWSEGQGDWRVHGDLKAYLKEMLSDHSRTDDAPAAIHPAPAENELPAAAASLIREALQRVALRHASLEQIAPDWSMKIPVDIKTWDRAVAFADKQYAGKPATRAVFLWHFIRKDDPASRLMALNLKDTGIHVITGGGESVSYGLEMIPGKTFSIRLGNDPTPHTGSIPVATSTLNFLYAPGKVGGDMLPGDKVVDVGNLTLMHRTIDHLEFASLDFQESGPLSGFTLTRKFSNGTLTVGGNISGPNETNFYYADFMTADGNSHSIKLPPVTVPPSLKSSPRSRSPAPVP